MAITKLKALGVTANTITASQIANDTITNTQINSSAAIAKTKLASLDIVNADINASAAIVRTKFASPLCVYAGSTALNGGFAAGAWEGVPFATEVIDTNNAFEGSATTNTNNAGVFTAPFAGKFLVAIGCKFETTTSNNLANGQIRIVKNTTGNAANGGTEIAGTNQGIAIANSVSTVMSASTSTIVDLASGNKIWCEAYANWWGGAWRCGDSYFSLMQVG